MQQQNGFKSSGRKSFVRPHWAFVLELLLFSVPVTPSEIPCTCFNDTLDCSVRMRTTFGADDLCGGDEITKANFTYSTLKSFPENLGDRITEIDISRSRLKQLPRPPLISKAITVLDISRNRLGETTDEFKDLENLRVLNIRVNKVRSLSFLPSPCSLEKLDLSTNLLTDLAGLERCQNLRWLDISENNIQVSDDIFAGVPQIRHLELQFMKLTRFPSDVFQYTSKLEELDISGNKLLSLSKEDFAWLPNLRTLILGSTGLSSIQPDVFSNIKNLKQLDISENEMSLPEGLLAALNDIEILQMRMCHVSSFPWDELPKMPQLKKLDLSFNLLNPVPSRAFSANTNLEWLSLENSRITDLDSNSFDGLSQLKHLDLSKNKLSSLPQNIFANLDNLNTLYLDRNYLETLQDSHQEETRLFSALKKLESLTLSLNNIKVLPKGVFKNLSNLKELRLGATGITEIPPNTFSDLFSIEILYLAGNKLQLQADVLQGLTSLKTIDLSKTGISELPEDFLKGLENLERFTADDNHLNAIPPGFFKEQKAIIRVSLQRNKFTSIPEKVFSDLRSLKMLILSENLFSEVSLAPLEGLDSLTDLFLSMNSLTTVPEFYANALPRLMFAYFTQNNITQVPVEKTLRTWLTDTGSWRQLILGIKAMTPASALRWAVDDPDISTTAEKKHCECGTLSHGSASIEFCLDIICPKTEETPSYDNWIEAAQDK